MTRQEKNQPDNTVIIGRNAVTEALRSGRELDKLFIAHGSSGAVQAIVAKCVQRGVVVKEVPATKLDFLSGGGNHQGVVLMAAAHAYATVEDMLRLAESRGEAPFLLLCDEIEDPHNLGAIIRTAEAAGAHGVVVPKRRSVGLTAAVYKASAGAVEYLPVARVTNLADTLRELKKRNIWVYGLDMDGAPWNRTDLRGAVALVVGSEGKGLSRLVRELCDGIVSLPMYGQIESLNASVACGILLYEAARQRHEA